MDHAQRPLGGQRSRSLQAAETLCFETKECTVPLSQCFPCLRIYFLIGKTKKKPYTSGLHLFGWQFGFMWVGKYRWQSTVFSCQLKFSTVIGLILWLATVKYVVGVHLQKPETRWGHTSGRHDCILTSSRVAHGAGGNSKQKSLYGIPVINKKYIAKS